MKEEQSKVFKVLRRNSTNTLKPKDKYFVYQEVERTGCQEAFKAPQREGNRHPSKTSSSTVSTRQARGQVLQKLLLGLTKKACNYTRDRREKGGLSRPWHDMNRANS